jgi:hypothetical protein
MLDFRYHALSLVAVFLALAIGIVLGVTIGDSLISDAERSLRGDLRTDVEGARADANKARGQVTARDRMLDQLYPDLVAGRLNGERVAIVSWGPLPDDVETGVRDAISKGGGRIDSLSVFDKPLTLLREAIGESEFISRYQTSTDLKQLGRSLARSLLDGGQLAQTLRDVSPDDFGGRFRRADAVVFYEDPEPADSTERDAGEEERADDRTREIESALVDEFLQRTIAVVGVEAYGVDDSQVPRYKSLKISSSDSVDVAGGRMALVFALAGAEGNFGLKATADQPLPDEALTP